MTYIWGKGTVGNLVTRDARVNEKYQSISYEEYITSKGKGSQNYYCLNLYYDKENYPEGHINIRFTRNLHLQKFKIRLEKAFMIWYEDTPDEELSGGDEIIGYLDLVYDETQISYSDKFETTRIIVFDDKEDQARKFIVEFENRRDRTNFLKILDKASRINLNDTTEVNIIGNILWGEGNRLLEAQNGREAIETFNTLLQQNPEDAHVWERLGIAYTYEKRYEEAIEDFNQSIALDNNYEGAYNNRGSCYYNLERYDDAIADYSRAIAIYPEAAVFYSNRGESYLVINKLDKAISDFNKAIKLNKNITETYNLRGEAYAKLGQYEKAIADFSRELEVSPDDPKALANRDRVLGLIYENKGKGK